MTQKELTIVALRYKALFLDINREDINLQSQPTAHSLAFVSQLARWGYCVTEELLHALYASTPDQLNEITRTINIALGVNLNWTPLVRDWQTPVDVNEIDYLVAWFANLAPQKQCSGNITLPCGHVIPLNTFPIERYNGCPLCGTPFSTSDFVTEGQGSKLRELRLFTPDDMRSRLLYLLNSSTPLDVTQAASLRTLLLHYPIPPKAKVTMKETMTIVIQALVEKGHWDEAEKYVKTPTDILRYLWYEKTGFLQIIEPKTLIQQHYKLNQRPWLDNDNARKKKKVIKEELKLHYSRTTSRHIAQWLNNLEMDPADAAENMNPKRGMWVRMIHALRLGEYSRHQGYEQLAELLDIFYKQDYPVWQGKVDTARRLNDAEAMLDLLKQRPGLFARCLFSTMLRFGPNVVLEAFNQVTDRLPGRLLISLANNAELYFDLDQYRIAHPITGGTWSFGSHPLLTNYTPKQREEMVQAIEQLYGQSMFRRFKKAGTQNKTIYINPQLDSIPISIGDRTTTIQDTSCALAGTRFPIEGDNVRLFLQWGEGLHAQHLDMDLSCMISYNNNKIVECAYFNLYVDGAQHSGDIQYIPEMVGTAEYIDLDLSKLERSNAQYVAFTCNAFTAGNLNPNMKVGWMNSAKPIKVDERTGVAYDPSCVQHIVRISENNLHNGLVFGVLDVKKREIIWMEMPFFGFTILNASHNRIEAMLNRLERKMSIGTLLKIKAEAQGLILTNTPEQADETYTYQWATDPAEVSQLLEF